MALVKGAYAIHQSGTWYTDENIDRMLMERHLNKKARRASHKNHISGPRKRTDADDEHFAQRIKRAKPQPGDIIITREAPIGDVGMIPENTECCLGQRMVLLRANQSVCDNFYLLYSLQSLYVQHQISWSEGTGTTVSNLRIPHLEQIQIPYLPLEQQAKISSVLRALEEKIENNRRLNDNLAA